MRPCILIVALLAVLLPAGARAAGKEFEVTVAAGKADRTNRPVCVTLSLSKDLAKNEWAVLRAPDGKVLFGQFTAPGLLTESIQGGEGQVRRDLHFILPSLKAGESLTLKADAAPVLKKTPVTFAWHDKPHEYIELTFGDRPVLRYVDAPFDD